MKRKIIALILLLINFGVCAKDRKIHLNCEGQEVINRSIYPEKNTVSNKIFSIEMVLTEGKVSFKKKWCSTHRLFRQTERKGWITRNCV
jgi:hypothetical protein